MTSTINADQINASFPIAGQDNSSQGFRDNFAQTKTGLAAAAKEITDLQNNALLKTVSGMTGVTLDNNLNGTELKGALISNFREKVFDFGIKGDTTPQAISIDPANGHFFKVETNGAILLNFNGFPTTGHSRVRVQIKVTNTTHTVTLDPAKTYIGIDYLAGYDATNEKIYFAETGTYLYEFSTADGTASGFTIVDLSQFRRIPIRSSAPTQAGSLGDSAGMMVLATSSGSMALFVAIADYGAATVWRKVTLGNV